MYKIIGGDGREYGPVSGDDLRQWIAEGRANAGTQVQPVGQAGWLRLADVPELAAALPGGPAAQPTTDQILARDYQVRLGQWIGDGWSLLTRNAGTLIGATLLVGVIVMGLSFVSEAGQALVRAGGRDRPVLLVIGLAITVAGWFGSLAVSGPLYGGLYWITIQRRRGVLAEVSEVFAGFRRGWLQLVLVSIVTGLLAALCVVPGIGLLAAGIAVRVGQGAGSALAIALLVVGGGMAFAGMLAAIYLSVAWMFSLPLVVDKQLGFWEAMNLSRKRVTRHWWGIFGASIVFGLIALAGVFACCVGLVFTVPLFFAMVVCAYEEIFGPGVATAA